MGDVNKTHELKQSLSVDVFVPGHEARTTTSLFERTKKLLIEREGGKCYVSGMTANQAGAPLEAHHHPIERSMANMIDWPRFAADCKAGVWGPHAQKFEWDKFDPTDPYTFVDDMTVNGMLLRRDYHTGRGEGIHTMPFPLWIAQKYGKEGYEFAPGEIIHHADAEGHK
jgi:hypothetical protein